jgi:hypothetical protein
MLLMIWFMPESPRYLAIKGKEEESKRVID